MKFLPPLTRPTIPLLFLAACAPLPEYGNTVWHQGRYKSDAPHRNQQHREYNPRPYQYSNQSTREERPRYLDAQASDLPQKPRKKSTFQSVLDTSNELKLMESEIMLKDKKARAAQGDAEAQAWVDEWEPKIRLGKQLHEYNKKM